MALIDEKTKEQLRERFARTLDGPVELRLYRRPDSGRLILPGGLGCQTCEAAEELARALVEAAPDRLRLSVIDVSQEPVQVVVEVMVFVTPTCPYCPRAAATANRMALASPRMRSLVVEANEYPELADRYQVQGVPRTVVNRSGAFVGALPEAMFVDSVLRLALEEAA